LGVLPSLRQQTLSLQAMAPEAGYDLVPEAGLRAFSPNPAQEDRRPHLTGRQWHLLQDALDGAQAFVELVRTLAHWESEDRSALQQQLRVLIHHHCGLEVLKTRQLMMDLQSL
jgi:DNA repair protein RecO (recombination protein O)